LLRRALGTCLSGLLLLAAPAVAQDAFDDPDEVLFGPAEEEDTGPDFAREGYYIQIGYSYGIARRLQEKLNNNRDQFALAPPGNDQFRNQRPVAFRQEGTRPNGNLIYTNTGRVNPTADGPCTAASAPDPCRVVGETPPPPSPLYVPLDEVQRSQVGGTIRIQPTPGLRPGQPTEFRDPTAPLDIYNPDLARTITETFGLALGPAEVANSNGVDLRVGSRVLPNLAVEVQLEYMTGFEVEIPNPLGGAPIPLGPPLPAGTFVDPVTYSYDTVDDIVNGTVVGPAPIRYLRASDTDKINVEVLNLTVNLKVPLLTGRVQPFLLLGGGVSFVYRDNDFPRRAIAPNTVLSSNPYGFEEYVNVDDTGAVLRIGGGVETYVTEHVYVSLEGTWVSAQGEKMNDLRYGAVNLGVGYRF
jgi:opacity protein-like surface antigen